jgi:uncharacterized protein YqgV (UPF0045/DUF77 family)
LTSDTIVLSIDTAIHGWNIDTVVAQRAKSIGGQDMLRSVLLGATVAVLMSATAMADNKSDCQKGVAMIKAELKKTHPAPVIATLRKALSNAETEVIEADWSECMDFIKTARAALGK